MVKIQFNHVNFSQKKNVGPNANKTKLVRNTAKRMARVADNVDERE